MRGLHAVYVGAIDKLAYSHLPPGGVWVTSTFHAGEPYDDALQFSVATADDGAVSREASAALTCRFAAGDPQAQCGAELAACQAR